MLMKKNISIFISMMLILSTLVVGVHGYAENLTVDPAMIIVADMEGELSSFKGWSNELATIQLASNVSPLGQAVEVVNPTETGKYPEFLLHLSNPLTTEQAGNVLGLAFWIKAPNKDISFRMNMRYDNGLLVVGSPFSLISESGTISNDNISAGEYIGIPANFTGWVVIPKTSFTAAFDAKTFVAFGFNYDPYSFISTSFYLDSFGFYSDYNALVESLTPKISSAMTIVADMEGEDSSALLSYNNGSATFNLASDVSPLGQAVEIVNPTETGKWTEFHLKVSNPLGKEISDADDVQGLTFWIKTPDKDISLNVDMRYDRGQLVLNEAYNLISEDGTVLNKNIQGSGLIIPANFTGWVVIPKTSFTAAIKTQPFVSFGFNYNPDSFISTSFYLDSFAFYTNYDALVESLTPETAYLPILTITKENENFVVTIENWKSNYNYQIWTYQKVQLGIFEALVEEENQWMLSKPYTPGNDRNTTADPAFGGRPIGFTEVEGKLKANLGSFNSINENYTVAVKVINGNNEFVGQYKETFTDAAVGVVKINKINVDGSFADEKTQVKEIKAGASVAFAVMGNGIPGTEYTATVNTNPKETLTATVLGGNEFVWDISSYEPGNYSVTLNASANESVDSRTINFKLYKLSTANYGELTGLTATGSETASAYNININPTATGQKFKYTLSEPWRNAIPGTGGLQEIPIGGISDTTISIGQYGIYQVAAYIYRDGVPSADDGAIRTVNYKRPNVTVSLNVKVDNVDAGTTLITKPKGTVTVPAPITFEATATELNSAKYSYWRRDANGWVLIRNYLSVGSAIWNPHRVGLYTIQVRARNADGLTYEVVKNIEFNITDGTDKKAEVDSISINKAELDAHAKARTPITITANATTLDNSEDLLYKYIISNGFIYYVETAYSADPTYIWVPGKIGDYNISVLVKNQVSFGKYDEIGNFIVDVK